MKIFIGVFALILSLNASAALIDNGSFITDTTSGLDWLKLESTYGKSYNEVSGEIASGGGLEGWQYATSTQWENMLFDQGLSPNGSCSNGANFCGFSHGVSGPEMLDLITLFGDAQLSATPYYPYPVSVGLLADIDPSNNKHQTALFLFDGANPYSPVIMANTFAGGTSNESGINGSWLVRATAIPEPSSLALLILGLTLSLRLKKAG